MANIKSQIKRVKTNNKANERNSACKSAMRTAIKKVVVACEKGDKELAISLLPVAFSKIDAAATSGIQHKNKAARLKSNLQTKVNAL